MIPWFFIINSKNNKKTNCIKCSASNVCEQCDGEYVTTTNDGCAASCTIKNYLQTKCVSDCVADDNSYKNVAGDQCVKGLI